MTKKIVVTLALIFSISGLNAQMKFTRKYGGYSQCGMDIFYPVAPDILRDGHDSVFISGTCHQEVTVRLGTNIAAPGYFWMNINPYGDIINQVRKYEGYRLSAMTEGADLYFSHTGSYSTVYPIENVSLRSNCIGKDNKVYFGGQCMNISKNYPAPGTTSFNSYFTKASPISSGYSRPVDFQNYIEYTSTINNTCNKIIPATNNNLCMMGTFYGQGNGRYYYNFTGSGFLIDSAFYLMELDTVGNIIWQLGYSKTPAVSATRDGMEGIMRDKNKNYVLCGHMNYSATDFEHLHLVKTDSQGYVLLSKTTYLYGGGPPTACWGIKPVQARNGDYVIVGNLYDTTTHGTNLFVMDINPSTFAINWSYKYPLLLASDIILTSDGGYAITGTSTSSGGALLLKVDKNGNIQWTKAFGALYGVRGSSLVQTSDHGYAVAGTKWGNCANSLYGSFPYEKESVTLVRTDSSGNSDCHDSSLTITKQPLVWNGLTDCTLINGGSLVPHDSLLSSDGYVNANHEYINENRTCLNCCITESSYSASGAKCVGDTMTMRGLNSSYKYEWYLEGSLISTSPFFQYAFKAEGEYDFHVKVTKSSNCYEDFCFVRYINATNKGFRQDITSSTIGSETVQYTYNDTSFKSVLHWTWNIDNGDTIISADKGHTSDTPLSRSPSITLSGGVHKACLTVKTGTVSNFCESTVCHTICVPDNNHDCCNCK